MTHAIGPHSPSSLITSELDGSNSSPPPSDTRDTRGDHDHTAAASSPPPRRGRTASGASSGKGSGSRRSSTRRSGESASSARLAAKKAAAALLPSVFLYKDFRLFLADWMKAKKKSQPGFSGQLFARKAGIASSTLLGMVIRGHRNLSADTIRGFIRALDLHGQAAQYFETLTLLNQAKHVDDQAHYLSRLTQLSPPGELKEEFKRLSDYAAYVGAWYHPLVRELAILMTPEALGGIQTPEAWIVQKLTGLITLSQAEQSLAMLQRMGLLEQKAPGVWVHAEPKLLLAPAHPDRSIQNFHRLFLEQLAHWAIQKNRDEREFGFVALAVSEVDFRSICDQVRRFWKDLLARYPAAGAPVDRVITVSLQAVQMSQVVSPVPASSSPQSPVSLGDPS